MFTWRLREYIHNDAFTDVNFSWLKPKPSTMGNLVYVYTIDIYQQHTTHVYILHTSFMCLCVAIFFLDGIDGLKLLEAFI